MPAPLLQWWTRKILLGANLAAPPALLATRFEQPALIAGAIAAHSAFAFAIMRPQCGWFGPVVTRFTPHNRGLWLTIDDGPVADSAELAGELRSRGVHATFFVKGRNVLAHAEAARSLLAAGHTLANHTHTHPAALFWWLRPTRLRREIDACNDALREVGAPATRWFRAPVGLKHARLHPALEARGMRLIAWTVRGNDGVECDPAVVAQRVVKGARPGAIVMLHEGRPRSRETILRTVDALLERGFSFVIPEDEQLV